MKIVSIVYENFVHCTCYDPQKNGTRQYFCVNCNSYARFFKFRHFKVRTFKFRYNLTKRTRILHMPFLFRCGIWLWGWEEGYFFLWWCSPEFRGGVQNCRRQQLIVELKVTNSKKSSQECKTALTSQFWSVMGSVMGLVMVSVMREVPTSQEISWTVGSSEFLNGHHPPTTDRPSVWYRAARETNNKKESILVCSKFLLKVTFTPYLKVRLKRRC